MKFRSADRTAQLCAKVGSYSKISTQAAAWMALEHVNANNLQHIAVLHRNYIDDCWPNSNFKEIIGIRLEFREVADMNSQN